MGNSSRRAALIIVMVIESIIIVQALWCYKCDTDLNYSCSPQSFDAEMVDTGKCELSSDAPEMIFSVCFTSSVVSNINGVRKMRTVRDCGWSIPEFNENDFVEVYFNDSPENKSIMDWQCSTDLCNKGWPDALQIPNILP